MNHESGVARGRHSAARKESQAVGLAQVKSGAKSQLELWHAAFHRENNGTAGRCGCERTSESSPAYTASRLNSLRREPSH